MVTELRIQPIRIEKMKRSSLNQFNPNLRRYFADKPIFRAQKGMSVPIEQINTEKKIARVLFENYGEGTYYLMGRSKGKNKYGNKPVRLCKAIIYDLGNENHSYKITETWRLRQRYRWFYKGR